MNTSDTLARAADLIAPQVLRKALRHSPTPQAPRAAGAAATNAPARGSASPAAPYRVTRNDNSEVTP